jgi:small subunit ribosomal protein S17
VSENEKDVVSTETTTAGPATGADEAIEPRGYRKTRRGYVVSDKMDKTVVVAVEDRVKHPLYGKVMRRTSKVKAHDEQNQCGVGDTVRIMETRPLSAAKRWRVVEIVEKAK